MNKMQITKPISEQKDFECNYHNFEDKPTLIIDIEEYLLKSKELGATHIKFDSLQNSDYDTVSVYFEAVDFHLETDEECTTREALWATRKNVRLAKELEDDTKEYNRLKSKLNM